MPLAHVNGTTLAYSDSGPGGGAPVLLSHSLFFDRTMFDPLTELLVGQGHRVVAYDHRGQGESAASDVDHLDMETLTDDAVALIEHLELGKVHAVGNSMGGFITLRLAARRPDLLLTSSAVGASAAAEDRLDEYAALMDVVRKNGIGAILDVLMGVMFGKTTLDTRPDLTGPWREYMGKLPSSIVDSVEGVIRRADITAELAGCQVPVLAIAGDQDTTYPQPIAGTDIAAASGGSEVTIADAGHSVALEQPEETGKALLGFFASAGG